MEQTIKTAERLATIEQDLKSMHRRMDNVEKLTECIHDMVTEIKAMRVDVNDVTDRVEEIEKKPVKRYETVVTAIITSIVGIIVGYLLNL